LFSWLKCVCFLYKIHVTLQCIVVSALKKTKCHPKFLFWNILSQRTIIPSKIFWLILCIHMMVNKATGLTTCNQESVEYLKFVIVMVFGFITRAPDNFQVQRVITPYFWKWWVFAYFLCTVLLSTSEKIAYMYTFKIMLLLIYVVDMNFSWLKIKARAPLLTIKLMLKKMMLLLSFSDRQFFGNYLFISCI
jgi:hypothetical protein